MTNRAARRAYAFARLAARLGARPASLDWARASAAIDAASYAGIIRQDPFASMTGLLAAAPAVQGDYPDAAHELEEVFRQQWMLDVRSVSGWYAEEDRPVLAHLSELPFLPAEHYLALGGKRPAWMEHRDDLEEMADTGLDGPDDKPDAWSSWFCQWQETWPADKRERRRFERFCVDLANLAGWHSGTGPALPEREIATRFFEKQFRKNRENLIAPVAFLGILAIDLRRLRGELLRRLLLPGRNSREAAA